MKKFLTIAGATTLVSAIAAAAYMYYADKTGESAPETPTADEPTAQE
jgi:hypothetical protein